MSDELKPCPMCKRGNSVGKDGMRTSNLRTYGFYPNDDMKRLQRWGVQCWCGFAIQGAKTRGRAIVAWNEYTECRPTAPADGCEDQPK